MPPPNPVCHLAQLGPSPRGGEINQREKGPLAALSLQENTAVQSEEMTL